MYPPQIIIKKIISVTKKCFEVQSSARTHYVRYWQPLRSRRGQQPTPTTTFRQGIIHKLVPHQSKWNSITLTGIKAYKAVIYNQIFTFNILSSYVLMILVSPVWFCLGNLKKKTNTHFCFVKKTFYYGQNKMIETSKITRTLLRNRSLCIFQSYITLLEGWRGTAGVKSKIHRFHCV